MEWLNGGQSNDSDPGRTVPLPRQMDARGVRVRGQSQDSDPDGPRWALAADLGTRAPNDNTAPVR
jgi:hypothetical protein